MTASIPAASVVVGSQAAAVALLDCLESLHHQAEPLGAEILIAGALSDDTRRLLASRFPRVRILATAPGLLVPELWGLGLQKAVGPIVALTTAQCLPAEGWLASLVQALRTWPEAAGLGGPIEPPARGSAADWAAWFARYSAYAPPVSPGVVQEIPGDNAAYRTADLARFWTDRSAGFWETLVHREMRRAGRTLRMNPEARVRLAPGVRPADFLRARFRHGRHFGATRPAQGRGERLWRLLLTPLLPALLSVRVGRRIVSQRRDLVPRYLMALPWLAVFFLAWSLGEAVGYLSGSPRG